MKKREILRKETEFTDIITNCPYVKNDYFVIYYKKINTNSHFGISVPKKTGKAHIRNKIKRRIKNIIDIYKKNIQINCDYVIIIRKRLIELDYHQMEESLISLIQKIGDKNERKTIKK